MTKMLGRTVIIKSRDGTYKGVLKEIVEKEKKIVVSKVKNIETGSCMSKDQHFFGDQLIDLTFVDNDAIDDNSENVIESKNCYGDRSKHEGNGQGIPDGGGTLTLAKDLFLDDSDTGTSLFQMDHLDPNLYLNDFDYSKPHENLLHNPPKALLIDQYGKNFDDAISTIKSQKVISFTVEGRKINRYGEISLVIIGTREMVYLFDVLTLKSKCFSEGLSSILEDTNLLKVVHDVRLISDCLSHVNNVKPKNVFDTQVADAFIYKQKCGTFPEEVATLTHCVQMYLNIHQKDCTFENDKRKLIQGNSNIWVKRPFDIDFLKACSMGAMYLRELRPVMLQRLLAEFLCGVDIYLDYVRDLSNGAFKAYNPRKLPPDFQTISTKKKQGHRKNHHAFKRDHIIRQNDSSGDEGLKSRSAWDTGREFQEKYQERHGEIVECMGAKNPLFDTSKPLLRKYVNESTPSTDEISKAAEPKNELEPRVSYNEQVLQNFAEELTLNKDNKQHLEKRLYDEFQMSTSDSDDSFIMMSSVNDHRKALPTSKLTQDSGSDSHRPVISNAGKRMLLDNIRPCVSDSIENRSNPNNRSPASYNSNRKSQSPIARAPIATESNHRSARSPMSQISTSDSSSNRNTRSPVTNVGSKHRNSPSPISHGYSSLSEDEYPTLANATSSRSKGLNSNMSKAVKPVGRGKLLFGMLSESPSPGKPLGISSQNDRPRVLRSNKSEYDFPSDDELLEVPHVAPMVDDLPIAGQSVNVLKKFHS